MERTNWMAKAHELGPELAEYSTRHDIDGTFVEESFRALKEEGFFSALVPRELGGGGAGLREICDVIRVLAHYDGSTALAYSMHSHLVATTVWKHRKGQPGAALLEKVVQKGLILVSTGAGDWLESNGELTRVEGGYRYTSKKPFASGSPVGDVMITSGRYDDPVEGPQVLHFPLAFATEGVTRGSDWDTHGMRGTGSSTVSIENAFIPEETIAMKRPRGPFHPAFHVICTVALPLIMSAYTGVAQNAARLAIESAKTRADDTNVQYLTGELRTQMFLLEALWNAHVDNANEYDFAPEFERSARSAEAKTAISEAAIRLVDQAMELGGGAAYFRKAGLEQLRRDVAASQYHPFQRMRQYQFSGRGALGLEPVPRHLSLA